MSKRGCAEPSQDPGPYEFLKSHWCLGFSEFFKVDRSERSQRFFFEPRGNILCVFLLDVNCRDHEPSWGRSYWMEIQQIIRVSQAQKMGILTWHMRLFLGCKIYVYTVFSFHHTK